MSTPVPRCVQCFRINDVRLANEIYYQDYGTRDGHFYAVYAYGAKQPYCYDCRHHMAALIRLVRMQQQDGIDVSFRNEAEPPMTDEERFLRCRNCGNSGIDMFGQPCVCEKGRKMELALTGRQRIHKVMPNERRLPDGTTAPVLVPPNTDTTWLSHLRQVKPPLEQDKTHLLSCSKCGGHEWACPDAESEDSLGITRLLLVCKQCHAHFDVFCGEQGPEIMAPLSKPADDGIRNI